MTVAHRPNRTVSLPPDNFVDTQLSTVNAQLRDARLSGALLKTSYRPRPDFSNADLAAAHLDCAMLESANFTSADLTSVSFRGARLQTATFDGADLAGHGLIWRT